MFNYVYAIMIVSYADYIIVLVGDGMKKSWVVVICMAIMVQLIACRIIDLDCFFDILPFNTNISDEVPQKSSNDNQEDKKVPIQRTAVLSTDINEKNNYNHSGFVSVLRSKPNGSPKYKLVTQKNGYNSLEIGSQRNLYDEISDSVYEINVSKNDKGYYPIQRIIIYGEQMPEQDIRKSIYAFECDNPLVFWVVNMFGFYYSGSNTVIELYSLISPYECDECICNMNARIDQIISALPQGMSEFDRELYLHDFLIENCSYDTDAMWQKDDWAAFTCYGALVNQSAVCEGYSKAMQALLSYAQMQCGIVSGVSGQSLHMWNVVMVDSNWYHLDVTWDDSKDMKVYDYFNVSDKVILKDHIMDPNYKDLSAEEICGSDKMAPKQYNLNVPECYESYLNYFNVMAVDINSLNHSSDIKVNNRLYDIAKNKGEYFSIKISDNLDYDNTIQRIFLKQPYKLFYYITEVNKMLDSDNQIDSSRIIYAEARNQNSVTIKLSYC